MYGIFNTIIILKDIIQVYSRVNSNNHLKYIISNLVTFYNTYYLRYGITRRTVNNKYVKFTN